MVKKYFVCFAVFFLAVNALALISAVDTPITIKYAPDYAIRLGVLNPYTQDYSEYTNFDGVFDDAGEITFTYSSSNPSFGLNIYVSQDNNKAFKQRYPEDYLSGGKYTAGEAVEIDIRPEWFQKLQEIQNEQKETSVVIESNVSESNETVEIVVPEEVKTETTENEIESARITPNAIFGETGSKVLKIIVYIIIGLLLLAILIMIGLRGIKMMKNRSKIDKNDFREIKIRKLSEMKSERKESMEDYNDLIDDAEGKLREALDTIESLRKNDKIAEIKKRMAEDEKELMRLRKGE